MKVNYIQKKKEHKHDNQFINSKCKSKQTSIKPIGNIDQHMQ